MVLKDLLAVGALDLLLGGLVAVLGETQDGVVVLLLRARVVISMVMLTLKKGGSCVLPSSPLLHAGASWGPRAH